MKRTSSRPFALALALALGAAASVGACSRSAPDEAPIEAPFPMVPPLPPPPSNPGHDRGAVDLPPTTLKELGLKEPDEDAGLADAAVEAGPQGQMGSTPFRTGRRASRAAAVALASCDALDGGDANCPLRAWMRDSATKAVLAKDFGALERVFVTLGSMAPVEGYPNWASITKDGAAATHVLHLDAVKATCRGCHQQYRDKYRTERRNTPLPAMLPVR